MEEILTVLEAEAHAETWCPARKNAIQQVHKTTRLGPHSICVQ